MLDPIGLIIKSVELGLGLILDPPKYLWIIFNVLSGISIFVSIFQEKKERLDMLLPALVLLIITNSVHYFSWWIAFNAFLIIISLYESKEEPIILLLFANSIYYFSWWGIIIFFVSTGLFNYLKNKFSDE